MQLRNVTEDYNVKEAAVLSAASFSCCYTAVVTMYATVCRCPIAVPICLLNFMFRMGHIRIKPRSESVPGMRLLRIVQSRGYVKLCNQEKKVVTGESIKIL